MPVIEAFIRTWGRRKVAREDNYPAGESTASAASLGTTGPIAAIRRSPLAPWGEMARARGSARKRLITRTFAQRQPPTNRNQSTTALKCATLPLIALLLAAATAHAETPAPTPKSSQQPTSPQALLELGKRYQYGVGAPQDLDRAIQLFCQAADLGNTDAAYQLGWIYSTGRAGKVDEILAAQWFRAAAAKNERAKEHMHRLGADNIALPAGTACVMREAMVARAIPRTTKATETASAKNAPSPAIAVHEVGRRDIEALIRTLAPSYRLDPELVLAMVEVESNFNPRAVSSKNAQGLMQLVPETAQRFGVHNVWDPVDNLRGGMSYMRWLLDYFNGDLTLALAGYNAGEKAVDRYGGIPPFAETQNYVEQVTGKLGAKTKAAGPVFRSAPAPRVGTSDIQVGDSSS
jgi:soluble lytic murein transglycosylase-like protein